MDVLDQALGRINAVLGVAIPVTEGIMGQTEKTPDPGMLSRAAYRFSIGEGNR